MRRRLLLAGLVAAVLVVGALLARPGRPPSPGAPGPAPGGTAPGPAAGSGAPGAPGTQGAAVAEHRAKMEGAMPGMGPQDQPVDEGTRAVRSHPITWKRLEAYVAAVGELRRAGQRDPSLMARLREPMKPGDLPGEVGARLDAVPEVRAILARHGLAGIDVVLLPRVVALGQNSYALEQEGRAPPPDEQNLAATALYRADLPRMDELAKAFRAELRLLREDAPPGAAGGR